MKRDAAFKVMEAYAISQRRACRLVSVDPKTVRREAEPDNPEVRARMREIAATRRRFGYRRIGLMLEREGITMNHKKLRRLYKEEGLAVKRRRGRKRATGTREPMPLPGGPTKRWSLRRLRPSPALPYAQCDRRLYPGMSGACGGHFAVRCTCGSRA